MFLKPVYYKVAKPFRYFRLVGHSASNSYIGASRVIEGVYEVVNSKPGQMLHCLPGGLFMGDEDGSGYEVRLRAPKPVFEKSYGGDPESHDIERLRKIGCLEDGAAPQNGPDYPAWRKRAVSLPEMTPTMKVVEISPELEQFKADADPIIEALSSQTGAVFEQYFDHFTESTVGARLKLGGTKTVTIEFCYLPQKYRVSSHSKELPQVIADLVARPHLIDLDVLRAAVLPAVAPAV